jgi:LPXTG-motif cell wall-anchored protein
MLRGRWGRTWRTLGAAILVLGITAGPLAATSSASTTQSLASFAGKGNGYALGVTVDLSTLPAAVKAPIAQAYTTLRNALPANLQAALPAQFNFVIDEKLIETLAQVGVSQVGNSVIGSGTIDLGKLLGGTSGASATSDGTSHVVTKALQLPSSTLPLLGVAAGVLDAKVAAGPTVSTEGVLSQVNASLAAISSLLPSQVQTELQSVFDQLTTNVNGVVDTANQALDSQLSSVATTLSNTTNPVIGGLLSKAGLGTVAADPTQLTTALTNAVKLPKLDVAGLLGGNLAAINDLHNVANSAKAPTNKVTSDASTSLANINVLNLLNVDAVDIASHSEAAGTSGSAKNTSSCKIGDVKLGGSNGVSLDGKNLYVNGTAIPTPLGNLDTIQSAVNSVTSQLGLSVSLCDAAQQDASADGTAAAQRVSAIRIELAPKAPVSVAALGINAGDPLLKIVIDPTVETSVAARLAAPVVPSNPSLPRTGAGALYSVLVGLGLAGTAIFLRRKFA